MARFGAVFLNFLTAKELHSKSTRDKGCNQE